jgi:hypothetical protein
MGKLGNGEMGKLGNGGQGAARADLWVNEAFFSVVMVFSAFLSPKTLKKPGNQMARCSSRWGGWLDGEAG